jgi:uncharacterized protein (DUF924 family)
MDFKAADVLRFWFEESTPAQWWEKDPAFDRLLGERFGALHAAAAACELWAWRATAEGRLAEILVLDQFSRNIFRNEPRAFSQDPLALALAQEAVTRGEDQALPLARRIFLYMPYMHSESKAIHLEAVRLFSQPGLESNLDFELRHQAIVDRFGRYPHRNKALGRASTAAETAFLREPGSAF